MEVMTDVTRILSQIEQGDPTAAKELLPLVYNELRRLAADRLASEKPGHTLQATALVHEAYIRLVGNQQSDHWDNRGHFFAAAAEAMRRILIDRVRRKRRPKHGGDRGRVELEQAVLITDEPSEALLALDEAIERFSKIAPKKAELVKLRFYAGLTIPEAAKALDISHATAERYWAYARVWLYSDLHETDQDQERT